MISNVYVHAIYLYLTVNHSIYDMDAARISDAIC